MVTIRRKTRHPSSGIVDFQHLLADDDSRQGLHNIFGERSTEEMLFFLHRLYHFA
jgi:hypothetical protein